MPPSRHAEQLAGGVLRDYPDLRDFDYNPSLGALPLEIWPHETLFDKEGRLCFGVRSQGRNSDCVGQSLAALVDIQWRRGLADAPEADRPRNGDRVSARMLYRMAQYHEMASEIGAAAARSAEPSQDHGVRSLRSAIKAFYHHGASLAASESCGADALWPDDDDRDWPSAAQAADAEHRFLGAYYRLDVVLNHFHAALRDTDTILVSAAIHDGWEETAMQRAARSGTVAPGTIPWSAERTRPTHNLHAFLIVGYTREGFLVLNSWGEGWGGVLRPGERDPAKSLKGIGLWTYGDWAQNVEYGWVMRLAVPGRDSFLYRSDGHGYRKRLTGRIAASGVAAMPQHELRGRFINLEDGLLVKSGTYATPKAACDEFRDTMRGLADKAGMILRFPGFLEPMADGFRRAARLKREYAALGLEAAHFFWSANFAEQILELITSAAGRAREIAGDETDRIDALVEQALAGIGRACWRDLVLSATYAVYRREEAAGAPGGLICGHDRRQPGKLGLAVAEIAEICREKRRPLHIITEGAGALVLRDLVELAEGNGVSRAEVLEGVASVTMLFPTIPVDEADRLLGYMETLNAAACPNAAAMNAAAGPNAAAMNAAAGAKAAAILLPSRGLELQLNCRGYGKSVNQLVSRAFVDRGDGPPRPVLGMSLESIGQGLNARLDAEHASDGAEQQRATRETLERIKALALEVRPGDLERESAVAQGARLITTDPGIEKIVRRRLRRLSPREGRPKGGEDRVQGAPATNGEGGSLG